MPLNEVKAGRHLPYARHVDDHTIETRDELLMQMIRLGGGDGRERLRDAILEAAGSQGFAFYYHAVGEARVLTLVCRGDLEALASARESLIAALDDARLLSVYETPQGPASEPLEFLSLLYNGELRPVVLPQQDAGTYLPYRTIHFGQETIAFGGEPPGFVAIVSIKDYPGESASRIVEALPDYCIVTQSFGIVEERAKRRWKRVADDSPSLFGEHHMTIAVRAVSLADVDRGIAEVLDTLAALGVVGVREEIALERAFWAQFPGNFAYIPRRGRVPIAHFAGFANGYSLREKQVAGNE